jgi:C-terminal peptidase prc
MRGAPGSKVTLTIARKGEDKPLQVPLVRAEIKVHSVKGKIVEPGYAWLRISQFQELTLDELVAKANALYAQDPHIKGLVLDLRNDPGGLLPGAIGVSSAFLPKDKSIVSTVGQLPDSNQTFYGRREFYAGRGKGDPLARLPAALKTVPMVVLVNSGSASASEIVAGALQDYKRAIIMGSQTFGKGSVQTLRQLTPDTAVKLTTARYYTPQGRSIQARGIMPDMLVDESVDGDGLNGLRVRESDLAKHLGNEADRRRQRRARRDGSRKNAHRRRAEEAQAGRVRRQGRFPAGPGAEPLQGAAGQAVQGRAGARGRRARHRRRAGRRRRRPANDGARLMNDDQLPRYSRHILLDEIGIEGQQALLRASALVIGAGGLGSPAALYLAASGVGRIVLVDDDVVDLTNLQRQVMHASARIGQPKVDSGRAALLQLNPGIEVVALRERAAGARLDELVRAASVVLDCSDNFATRHAVNRACVAARVPLVSGAAIRFDGQLSVFRSAQPIRPATPACSPRTPASRTRPAAAWACSPRWSA